MTRHPAFAPAWRPLATAVALTLCLIASLLAVPAGPAAGATGDTVTIMDIQGGAHLSPLVEETVTTTGVVTAVAFGGFYLQDPAGDGDPNTSDGIFVDSDSTVAVGDEVEVTGAVEERIPGGAATGNLSITEIDDATATVLSSGNPVPSPVIIGRGGRIPPAEVVISDSELPTDLQVDPAVFNPDIDGIDFYEALEGMFVEIDRPVAVSATRQFSEFSSEVFTLPSNGRFVKPRDARTGRGGIFLQPDPDNRGDQNPERVQIQFDATIFGNPPPAINLGDRLGDVRGVVGYSFGNYEVNATEPFDVRPSRLRPERTNLRPVKGHLTVASYNVLNLSATTDDDDQRDKLADQIVNSLRNPDVIAVQEIQDNNGEIDDGTTDADETLQRLVDAIAAAGGPSYAAFDVAPADGTSGGAPGSNIRNAFLYNPDRVRLVDFVSLTPGVLASLGLSNPDAFTDTRDPLVAEFEFNGVEFTVVNNHLTSRFGSSPIFGGPQPFVQAGELEREAQVGALNEFVDLVLGADPDAAVMVVGDLNTFEWTNDLAEILPEGDVLTNLALGPALDRGDRKNLYTFIFDGNSQALDHFFVTDALVGSGTKLDIVHANVDFTRLDADVVASDHEPLVARFRMRRPPTAQD
ncbi:MAG: endonuclease/exonuclease/phosphatase family protein [Acidimicrobiia bacterium]|nr:endonuclease/exonuclease/phosphatase family protein [Acidimicrobiia bacterium]